MMILKGYVACTGKWEMRENIFFRYLGVDELIILKCIYYSGKATDWTVRDSKPRRGKRHSSFPKRPDRLWSPPSFQFKGYRHSFLRLSRPGREVRNSSPTTAEVRNEWSYTSSPPVAYAFMTWGTTLTLTSLLMERCENVKWVIWLRIETRGGRLMSSR
jgi:hypothetical protein